MDLIPGILVKRWSELISRFTPAPTEVAFIFESSDRLDPLVMEYFKGLRVHRDDKELTTHKCFMGKSAGLEELEVADIIAHTLGSQASDTLRGQTKFRKDYEAIFRANPDWSSAILVSAVARKTEPVK